MSHEPLPDSKKRRVTHRTTIIAVSIIAISALHANASTQDASDNPQQAPETTTRDWPLGPFSKRKTPILTPNAKATFICPISGKSVKWEEQNVYNPAAVVCEDKVYLLYRADDMDDMDDMVEYGSWNRSCRTGLAVSKDGRQFSRMPEPVIYPDNDNCKAYEWVGGVEDIHITEDEAGTYYVYYTALNKDDTKYPQGWSGLGQALLDRLDDPFVHAQFDWELKEFCSPALAENGLVFFKGEWLLYYGGADRRIGLAAHRLADPHSSRKTTTQAPITSNGTQTP